jgi:hypothetical protein
MKLLLQSFFLFFSFGASVLYYYQMQSWSNVSYHYSRCGPRPGKTLDEPGTKRKFWCEILDLVKHLMDLDLDSGPMKATSFS